MSQPIIGLLESADDGTILPNVSLPVSSAVQDVTDLLLLVNQDGPCCTISSSAGNLPLEEISRQESCMEVEVNGVNSGAVLVQPAPTVLSTECGLPAAQDAFGSRLEPSSDRQLRSSTPCGVENPVGLLPGKSFPPLQEHSPSTVSFDNSLYLKNSEKERRSLEINKNSCNQVIYESSAHNFIVKKSNSVCNVDGVELNKIKLLDSNPDITQLVVLSQLSCSNVLEKADEVCPEQQSQDSITVDVPDTKRVNKAISYSRALAPPNTYTTTTGAAPECGIVLERLQNVSLDSYAWAIVNIIGKNTITFIGRAPGNENSILVFVKTADLADELVEKGIWLKGKWLNVSHFQQPATKLVISGIMPFIPDSVIIEALSQFGSSVYPILRKIPAAVRNQIFKGTYSYRREVYLVKTNKDVVLPTVLNISFLGVDYPLEVSTTGAKCFSCGSLLHTVSKCDHFKTVERNASVQINAPINVFTQTVEEGDNHKENYGNCSSTSLIKQSTSIHNTKKSNVSKIVSGKKDFFIQCGMVDLPPIKCFSTSSKTKSVVHSGNNNNNNIKDNDNNNINKINKKKSGILSLEKKKSLSAFNSVGVAASLILEENEGLASSSLHQDMMSNVKGLLNKGKKGLTLISSGDNDLIDNSKKKKKPRRSINRPIVETVEVFHTKAIDFSNMKTIDDSVGLQDDENEFSNMEINSQADVDATSLGADSITSVPAMENIKKGGLYSQSLMSMSSGLDVQSCYEVLEDWFKNTASLKFSAKKKLVYQLINSHPNIEDMLMLLSASSLYPPSSAKGKKIKDLLVDIKLISSAPREERVKKRKQVSLSQP